LNTTQRTKDFDSDLIGDDIMADIGRLAGLQQNLQRESRLLRDTLAAMVDAVITTDHLGCINYINAAAEHLIGCTQEQVTGRALNDILKLYQDGSPAPIPHHELLQGPRASWRISEPTSLVTLSGEEYLIRGTVAPILDGHGEFAGLVVVLRDSVDGDDKALAGGVNVKLDAVTGLLNRIAFEQRLHTLLDGTEHGRGAVLLYLDLDEFKIVNDTCGHIAGDALLRQVALVLRDCVATGDTLAHLGGDEFGVLLVDRPIDDAYRIANEICAAIQAINFDWQDKHFRSGASIGMVLLGPGHDDTTTMLRDADRACYAAKEGGRNQVHFFGDEGPELALQAGQMNALSTLNDAMTHDRLALFAQPILHLGGEAIPHVEILLRMRDANGQIVFPGAFLPAAERYHQMPLVDRWVLARTFESIKKLDIAERYIFAINLSGQSVGRRDFLEFVLRSFEQYAIDPNHICFELTEGTAITNVDGAENFLSILGERGCRFALDDFGVGVSSLTYLRRLPIDYLKIDGSFIRKIGSDPINEAMVRAIHQVAQVANVKTVAESIESLADLRILQAIGIDLIQGYLIAQPMPLEQLTTFSSTEARARVTANTDSNDVI
jgi:ammonium transporter, Amt family